MIAVPYLKLMEDLRCENLLIKWSFKHPTKVKPFHSFGMMITVVLTASLGEQQNNKLQLRSMVNKSNRSLLTRTPIFAQE